MHVDSAISWVACLQVAAVLSTAFGDAPQRRLPVFRANFRVFAAL
jgi:hypothetical protein